MSGLRRVDVAGIAEIEPHARGVAALHSPNTGVVDFGLVARSLARDVLEAGGGVVTGCEIGKIAVKARSLSLAHAHGTIRAGRAVFCAGAWSDRLAVAAGAGPDPRIVPFRGAYLRLAPERSQLVRSLIYPVPDPSLPFLGVHLTRRIGDDVLIGPTALLALARDAYHLGARAPARRDRHARMAGNMEPPAGGPPGLLSCAVRHSARRSCARRRATCPSSSWQTSGRALPACAPRRLAETAG